MNTSLYQANILAIPLKEDITFTKDQPNYLIVDNYYGKFERSFEIAPNNFIDKVCVAIKIRFVERTLYADGTLQEMVFPFQNDVEYLPYEYFPLLESHKKLEENEEIVNYILGLFKFRNGNRLEGLILQLDTEINSNIVDNEFIRTTIIILNSLTYKEDVEDYLLNEGLELSLFEEYSNFTYSSKPNRPTE